MRGLLLPQARVVVGGLVGMLVAIVAWSGVLDPLEDLTVDYRLRFRGPQPVSDEVRLVGIGDDDVSSQLGQWPFPRKVHGDVLRILNAVGAKHIAVDVLFTEHSKDADQDVLLQEVIGQQPDVTLAYYFERAEPGGHVADSEDRPHFIEGGSRFGLAVNDLELVRGRLPVGPYAELRADFGAVNAVPDADGVIRRVPLFFAHEGRLYPSLAMQTIISTLGLRDDQIRIVPGQEVTLVDSPRGTLRIPIDAHCQYRINFLGDLGVFTPAFEYLDLYHAVESPEVGEQVEQALRDRIVLIGLASTGNTDVISSSIGRIPGVAVQATVVSNILSGDHLRFLPRWQQALSIVLAGAVLGLGMWPARVWLGMIVFLAMTVAWCLAALISAKANVMMPVIAPLATFGFATLALLSVEAATMKKDRSRMVGVLGRYIARPVLERLIDTGQVTPAAAERREVTVFFSDIKGFTSWTERVEPDEVALRLNEYFSAMTPLVERHGGTLDKFIGDSIMVFFGTPRVVENHALRAVRMALEMQREMDRLNEQWSGRGYDPLQIGIGIHTGFATIGSFGSSAFLDYTVIGRTVNLASRIESQAEGGMILVSARTHSLVRDKVRSKAHPDLVLKGIPEPQAVVQVLHESDQPSTVSP